MQGPFSTPTAAGAATTPGGGPDVGGLASNANQANQSGWYQTAKDFAPLAGPVMSALKPSQPQQRQVNAPRLNAQAPQQQMSIQPAVQTVPASPAGQQSPQQVMQGQLTPQQVQLARLLQGLQ
jgi:hypothetical protein